MIINDKNIDLRKQVINICFLVFIGLKRTKMDRRIEDKTICIESPQFTRISLLNEQNLALVGRKIAIPPSCIIRNYNGQRS